MNALRSSCALFILGCALAAACGDTRPRSSSGNGGDGGGDGGAGGTAGIGGAGASSSSAGGAGGGDTGPIPDPGMQMGAEWTDIEPNDIPSQAVPVGIMTGPIWAGFVMPYTAISSPTDVDYFVFKTGDAASLANVNIQICWSFTGNLLDLNLYTVVNSQKGPLALSSTSTDTSCETMINFGEGPAKLTADTTYLLEVFAGPGLNLAGDPGLYSA
jgi:hypothetical protein